MATTPRGAPAGKPATRSARKGTAGEPAAGANPGVGVGPSATAGGADVPAVAADAAKRAPAPPGPRQVREKKAPPVSVRTQGPPTETSHPVLAADNPPLETAADALAGAMVAADQPRPFIIWTLRRTGGTNLAQRLFMSSPFPTVEHEPFNGDRVFGPISRLWHGSSAVDPTPELVERRQQALTEALTKRPLIKHCVELFGDAFNLALLHETVRLGYRHLFLYRRQQADRLLSLHVAKSTGQWGPRQAPTAGSMELPPVPAQELVAHGRHCNRLLTLSWDALVALGAPVHMLAFEDIYQESDAAQVRERLSFLCNFLLGGDVPADAGAREDLLDKLTPRGGRGERASPHEVLPGVALLRREMAWQPGFEPTRTATPADPADQNGAAPPPEPPMDGLWVAPWSIGYQPVPMAARAQVQKALYRLAVGTDFTADPAQPAQGLGGYLAARHCDLRNARFRFSVVMRPARRFVATYAHFVLQQGGLAPHRLQALAAQHPDRSGAIRALRPDPTLTQFVAEFQAYLQVPEVAALFRPVHQILGSLDRFDRVYAAERLGSLADDLTRLTGRTVQVMPAPAMPKIPAADNNAHTLECLRALCAADVAFLAPVYAAMPAPAPAQAAGAAIS